MLTALQVNRAEAGYHYDGGGLVLQVSVSGARSWLFRYDFRGKRHEMGLGPTHTIGLAEAREVARLARQQLLDGINPLEARRTTRQEQKLEEAKALTFAQCCEQYIAAHESGWKNAKHASQWRSTLQTYCADFNDLPVASVGQAEVLKCLETIWKDKTETASRLRGRIESVLDWATVRGFRSGENAARWKGHLDHLLPTISKAKRVQHHRAMPWRDIKPFMVALRQEEGISARALEFAILTACRSGEVRGAQWEEFDLAARIWTIPAHRMKASREHRVPLSPQAVSLLNRLPREADEPHVFLSGKQGKPLSDMALIAVLRRMKVNAVPHGFRSTFRDWAGESTAYPREVCEHALAHKLADGVEAAYQRGDMLQKRVSMMKDWADYCDAQSTTTMAERLNELRSA
ncbi:MAG: integrase arm-type DNA-binding domain-containing protein [Rhodocyclaceae bacterium]